MRSTHSKSRLRLGAIIFLSLAGFVWWLTYVNPRYSSESLSDYPTSVGVVTNSELEQFLTKPFPRRVQTPYYEAALYLEGGGRYFLRTPDRAIALRYLAMARQIGEATISHLPQEERNGGYRIVNLVSGERTLYSLQDALDEQSHRRRLTEYFGLIFIIVGVALLSFSFRRNRSAA